MGYRNVSLFGVDVLLRVPDRVTNAVRSAIGLRHDVPDQKVMERNGVAIAPITSTMAPEARAILERIAQVPMWYHTIELGHGVVTPGGFDHRPYLSQYPIPASLDGKRVLDVATYDGFWAFEFARRGAAEVIAIDLDLVGMLDLPVPARRRMTESELQQKLGVGFNLCREILGSHVRREILSVYDLDEQQLGKFDFVFMSDLLLHLMNPMKALQNVCKVTDGTALIVETFDPNLPGELMKFQGGVSDCVWWRMSYGALEKMVKEAGFASVECVAKFPIGQTGESPWLWHAAFRCSSQ